MLSASSQASQCFEQSSLARISMLSASSQASQCCEQQDHPYASVCSCTVQHAVRERVLPPCIEFDSPDSRDHAGCRMAVPLVSAQPTDLPMVLASLLPSLGLVAV